MNFIKKLIKKEASRVSFELLEKFNNYHLKLKFLKTISNKYSIKYLLKFSYISLVTNFRYQRSVIK